MNLKTTAIALLPFLLAAGTEAAQLQSVPLKEDLSGIYGSFSKNKPAQLKAEPQTSNAALYATISSPADFNMIARVDQKMAGKFDRMILDVNRNNDLTDDPVMDLQKSEPEMIFGQFTIKGPAAGLVSEIEAYSHGLRPDGGCLHMRPKTGFEAIVSVDGQDQRLVLVDNNGNGKLGDVAQCAIVPDQQVRFDSGDMIVIAPAEAATESMAEMLGGALYVNGKPYRLVLGESGNEAELQPITENLGTVKTTTDSQVEQIVLAREVDGAKAECLVIHADQDGTAMVPAGTYRPVSVQICAGNDKEQWRGAGEFTAAAKPLVIEAAQEVELPVGAPVTITVAAQPKIGTTSGGTGVLGMILAPGKRTTDIEINATLAGLGGETYGYFRKDKEMAPAPAFKITDHDGMEVAKGNLEYG